MFRPFTGTIDDLLKKVDTIDPDEVERIVVDQTQDVLLPDDLAIELIMSEAKLSREDAERILTEVKLEEVDRAIARLIEQGLVEVTNYGEDGAPLYGLTSEGKQLAGELKK